jgi:hypothetical protein
MSFLPKTDEAAVALMAITKDLPFPTYVYPSDVDRVALREVLIGVVCPIPCVGEVNDEGWHKLCEAKADAAMVALFGS